MNICRLIINQFCIQPEVSDIKVEITHMQQSSQQIASAGFGCIVTVIEAVIKNRPANRANTKIFIFLVFLKKFIITTLY